MVLGGLLHFLIAFGAAAVYYAARNRIGFPTRRPILAGLLYGVPVWAFMNGIVLPLSALYPPHVFSVPDVVVGVIMLSCLVGLPVSLIVSRAPRADSAFPVHSPGAARVKR